MKGRKKLYNLVYLIEEQFSALLFPQVHLLDGHLAASSPLRGDAHDAGRTFANLDEVVKVFPRVARTHDILEGGAELKQKSRGHENNKLSVLVDNIAVAGIMYLTINTHFPEFTSIISLPFCQL